VEPTKFLAFLTDVLLLVVATGGKCMVEVKHVSLVVREVASLLGYVA
jgi:hypothetical protein